MRVLVSGASGLIGGALVAALPAAGHACVRLVRHTPRGPGELAWDPAAGSLDRAGLEGVDAVVHLAGEPIAGGRWTAARRERIESSRVRSTALLASALAGLARPPAVMLCASAMGFYGDRGDEFLTEASPPGRGFLGEVAARWEAAAAPAAGAGIRVVHSRFGLVLAAAGGALHEMLPIFRAGLGGPFGNGRQWCSWVTLADTVRALVFAIGTDALRGPFNVVAPEPVRNAEFARALGRVLRRPALLPAPAFALRLVLGRGAADELLLASQRISPVALHAAGFHFADGELEPALRATLATA